MRYFIFLLVIILTFSSCSSQQSDKYSSIGTSQSPFSATIQFEDSIFDFGRISAAHLVVQHSFYFQNTSKEPIVILRVKPSCHCTSASYNHDVILPGHRDSIIVKFDATGENSGVFYKSVLVCTNTVPDCHTLSICGSVE